MNSYDFLSFLSFPSTVTKKLLSFPPIIFFLLSTLVYVWIQGPRLRISLLHVSFFIFYFLFFIFMHAFHCFRRHRALFIHYSRTVHALFTYCSWDSQPFYSKKNIKNRYYDTIHIFKNYFPIIFSIFNKINYIQNDLALKSQPIITLIFGGHHSNFEDIIFL